MRASLAFGCVLGVAGLLSATAPARADATIAGRWHADLGSNVAVTMDVTPDGHWTSVLTREGKVSARMAGTYDQTAETPSAGKVSFTPTASEVTAEHGAAKVEHDTYRVLPGGREMSLTSKGDTIMFHKQPRS